MRPRIVCFGDSLTQEGVDVGGWTNRLGYAYRRKADVLNRGFSGYNTRMALRLLGEVFDAPMALATVCFGANDAVAADRNPAQAVPLAEFEASMQQIVAAAARVARAVVVITPPPVDAALWPDRCCEAALAFGAAARRAAESVKEATASAAMAGAGTAAAPRIVVVDAYPLVEGAGGVGTLLRDGLHYSAAGHDALAAAILAAVAAEAPGCAPDALGLDAPIWRDVDATTASGLDAAFAAESLRSLRAAPFTWA